MPIASRRAEEAERWETTVSRLRIALAAAIAFDPALGRSVEAQSERYRTAEPVTLANEGAVRAYAAARMPATMAAAGAAMRAAARAVPALEPRSLLDLGCGPGSAAWAAVATWPGLEQIRGLDRAGPALELASTLGRRSDLASLAAASWQAGDVTGAALEPADLVSAAYLLGELPSASRAGLVARMWDATEGLLLIVEPGTPAGFGLIRDARAGLVAMGATIAAPCPHDRACPMADPDWCHFAVRLARSRLHRRAKGAELPFEDEPYSYVVATRLPVARGSRVLARPAVRSGAVGLRLCTVTGIETRTVSRRDGEAYRDARHLEWGSSVGGLA